MAGARKTAGTGNVAGLSAAQSPEVDLNPICEMLGGRDGGDIEALILVKDQCKEEAIRAVLQELFPGRRLADVADQDGEFPVAIAVLS